jgi:SIR2-like protein
VTQALSLLPDSGTSLAVLAGAGISLDSPSNLLAGRDFMDAVLSRIMPKEIDSDTAQSLISVSSDRHFRPGEYIRFETLMGELVQSRIDPDLHVLDCLDECEHPNFNHYVLAELVRRGSVVMTTNFDRLIEVAYQRTAKPGELPLRVVYNDAEFPSDGLSHSKEPVLWKLHGSLSVGGQSTRASLQATLVQIMWPTMSRNKRMFLQAVLASRDMLLVGYSGSDDLDLVPVLAEAPRARAMLWVNHSSRAAPAKCETAPEVVSKHRALTQYEVVGRDRVFFTRGLPAVTLADHPDKTALISMSTSAVMEELRARYAPDLVIPAPSAEYEFGSTHTGAVRSFFDNWIAKCSPRLSARYLSAMNLFSNRGFRADVSRLRDRLHQRYRELITSPAATPEEQFDCLMDEFNTRDSDSIAANRRLFDAIQGLIPQLPEILWGAAHRLSACAVWNQERREEAAEIFRLAWGIDKDLGQLGPELATLTTWQRSTNSLRDHLSTSEHHQFNEIARMVGDPIFPDDAFYRLQELAEQTGYKLNIWQHLLQTFDVGFVEEDPDRRRMVRREARNMLRVAVDVGDVYGEAKARLLLALSLQEAEEFEEATEHVVCLLELGKVLDLGEADLRGRALLQMMGTEELARRYERAFAVAMWA